MTLKTEVKNTFKHHLNFTGVTHTTMQNMTWSEWNSFYNSVYIVHLIIQRNNITTPNMPVSVNLLDFWFISQLFALQTSVFISKIIH